MRLVQLTHPGQGRRVALVEEPALRFLRGFTSIYNLANSAMAAGKTIPAFAADHLTLDRLEYDTVYNGESDWKLLPAFDHPGDHQLCMVSGTGLTHQASAENRQKMHTAALKSGMTDSMKMYRWGVERGRPAKGTIGVQPEWFYKGNGSVLRGHGEVLCIPAFGDDGGEEPEVAGAYLIDSRGQPRRVGYAVANEFSDHIMERKNYLYLAPSKIRPCSIGPELCIAHPFKDIKGRVTIWRQDKLWWRKDIRSGEENMAHSLANLEYHHFKYASHRLPGQAHIHFYGADAFSFGEQILLEEGDVMEVFWEGMGRALRNVVGRAGKREEFFRVKNV